MKSLADVLAESPPGSPARSLAESLGLTASADRVLVETTEYRHLSAKQFARTVIESPEYRDHIRRMVTVDGLPPAVEALLWHYAYGKPADKLKIVDETPRAIENFSAEQLEERALHLAQMARNIRMNETSPTESDEDSPGDSAIH